MKEKIISFLKSEAVLVIASLAALISMFFVPPCKEYWGYINPSVISMLFCLMIVVAGLISTNLFGVMSHKILHSTNSERIISAALVAVTFFSSMLITNDVALITFVPFTIGIFGTEKQKRLIFIITMETVAANLGSMLTPIGNPQNLYLYDKYNLSIAQFMGYVLPVGAVGAAIIAAVMIFRKDDIIESKSSSVQAISSKAKLAVYLILFAVCAASVLRFLDYRICLAVIVISIFITDKKLFVKVDYALLLTFVAFFIFVGNGQGN